MRKLLRVSLIMLLVVGIIVVAGCGPGGAPATATSSPAVQAGAPAKLAFITQPSGAAAGPSQFSACSGGPGCQREYGYRLYFAGEADNHL